MHANYIDDIRKNTLYNLDSKYDSTRNGKNVTTLDRLKSCCHHSLRDLCVHTDGAWWKYKKYCTHEDIDNYPDGCIICLNSFSVEFYSPVNMSTQIMRMKGNEKERERERERGRKNAWSV